MKYEVRFTTQFKKDLKLAKKQGKDTEKLFAVIEKLANGEPLEEKYRDHDLSGNYKGCRECHIEPDWLLVYEVIDDVLVLMLYRVGSHSDLFRQKLKRSFFVEIKLCFSMFAQKSVLYGQIFTNFSVKIYFCCNVHKMFTKTKKGIKTHMKRPKTALKRPFFAVSRDLTNWF